MTLIQKINARIVDKLTGGVETTDIRKQLDSLLQSEDTEDYDYALKHLPSHMVKAARFEQLHQWLTDFDFIAAKISHPELQSQDLIEDYDRAFEPKVSICGEKESTLKLIQGAIRLSAHVMDKDKTQLAEQLLGRLMSFKAPEIQALLAQSKQKQKPWLRPLTPSLMPPGGRLLRTLTKHSDSVQAVAITPDGKQVVSASSDNTLKLWDLESGTEIASFNGDGTLHCCAVAPDGVTIVAGEASGRVHFLRLEQ
jgi:WD40 repeat protein